ncbi:tRNA (guanosine(37)-N1)-methyltransferase TrmD [Candidatus Kaiserbacteria bacterium RIFCSPHIGHO2_02_FULL_49_34]|uniref:tRNA (guanine-N(1)-)-methyltransferase n=1 Tax=Candidatus Kaiserbacteria bacterium RIFCSPHIGHO2_02_FULL_49_34 TaxID=1798491 RepID=A0A1F6DIT8_9BACT|nr:MAG: tRNA (guanosine(37)-N1)-methyltransferase TrmD [Candidatus Kaiserbacteria bacterium RIFCSPHIGHO2_02_FULL_49_34]
MNIHVITLFPEVCKAYTDASVLGRAQVAEKGKGAKQKGVQLSVNYYNPRDYSEERHTKVDGRPFGGGPGMVMMAEPILAAYKAAIPRVRKNTRVLMMSPRGRTFDQAMAKELAERTDNLVLIAGRYEGIDARVKEILGAEEVSVGDYVLTGGELPALTIIDAVARHIPGVLGDIDSLEDDRATSGITYTKPVDLIHKKKHYPVPEILLSGHTANINAWREGKPLPDPKHVFKRKNVK